MNLLAYLRCITAKFLNRAPLSDDMEEELRSHILLRADDLVRSGLDLEQAQRRARIEFGSRGKFKQECQEALGGNFIEILVQDARFSLRVLRKSRAFTFVAIVTLALAIGANALVFGLMDALILRPLNVPQPENVWGLETADGSGYQAFPNYLEFRDRNHSFDGLAGIKMAFVGLDAGNDPSQASGWETTGNYFDVLRIKPYLGRFFHASDEHGPNSAPYLVLSYAYWQSHFQSDRGVIGRTVRLNKHPFTVIGVAPPEFHGTLLFLSLDFFMPIVNQAQADGEDILNRRAIDNRSVFEVLGRLKTGVTPAQAIGDLNSIAAYLEKTYPKEVPHQSFSLERPGLYVFARPARAFVGGLMLLAGLILLAACANLGGLFAARALDRSREVALRLALGSTRSRVLRALFTEAALISFAGGALGLLISIVLLNKLSVWEPFPETPLRIPVNPDAKLYLAALALALLSGLLFGIVPVRQVLRTDPFEIVKSGARTIGARGVTVRDLLLIVQIAICAVLVTSSMVAIRGLLRSLHSNLGFEPQNALLVNTSLNMAGYSGEKVTAMQRRMIDAIKTIPGVQSVGLVNNYPPLVDTAANRTNAFKEETADLLQSNAAWNPFRFEVSPGYFEAAGTALLTGRTFSWHDDQNAPVVAVINLEFARRLSGSVTRAIGKRFKLPGGKRVEVVGVVEDGKYLSLTEEHEPAIFLSFLQSPTALSHIVVRAIHGRAPDPQQLAAAVRGKLRKLDPGLPVNTQTWSSTLDVVLFPSHVATVSLGVLGFIGAMLSLTGIFGMAAYSVSKRLKELGIRVALGAKRKEVLDAALGRACRLLAIGSVAGLLLGVAAARVLSAIVYQATPRDPLVLAGVVLAMSLLGVLAIWVPAQRALTLDPGILLREE